MSDFTQLQADITDILASDDVNTALAIRLAEDELKTVMRLQDMLDKATITVALTGDRYIGDLPATFLEAFHVEQDDLRLEYRTPHEWWHDHDNIYTIMGNEIHVSGASDLAFWYYSKPTALSGSNATNTYTDKCYTALLFLALAHAAFYMGDMAREGQFRAKAVDIAQATNLADMEARTSGAPLVQRG